MSVSADKVNQGNAPVLIRVNSIRYCTQDIVVYREDLFNALSRNALLAPRLEEDEEPSKHVIYAYL